VAFLALLVFEGSVCRLTVFCMIILILCEMNDDVFYAVGRLGVKKLKVS